MSCTNLAHHELENVIIILVIVVTIIVVIFYYHYCYHYRETKDDVKDTFNDAKDSIKGSYRETKDSVKDKYNETNRELNRNIDQAKQSWHDAMTPQSYVSLPLLQYTTCSFATIMRVQS